MNNNSTIQLYLESDGEIMQDANNIDTCDCVVIHEEVVNQVRAKMPEDDILMDLADAFKIFSDFTRVKILYALIQAEMCVCDISSLLGMTKSSVSHQLRVLRQSNLVKYRKEGRVIYYSIADSHVELIIKQCMEHVME